MSLETRIVKHACHRCNAEFDMTETYVEGLKMWVSSGGLCPTCDAAYGAEVERQREKAALPFWRKRWESMTPAEFRVVIDRARLPDPFHFDRVMGWTEKEEKTSLLIVGDTGMGKTRALYALLARILARRPAITIEHFDCIGFGETAREKAFKGQGREWFERLRTVDFVLFDDLFRGVLTDQVQEELFGLISVRTENRLPILATTQFTAETLERSGVLKAHHAAAIARRLRDYFTVVPFKRQPK